MKVTNERDGTMKAVVLQASPAAGIVRKAEGRWEREGSYLS